MLIGRQHFTVWYKINDFYAKAIELCFIVNITPKIYSYSFTATNTTINNNTLRSPHKPNSFRLLQPLCGDAASRMDSNPTAHWEQNHQSIGWISQGEPGRTVRVGVFSPWPRPLCSGVCCSVRPTVPAWCSPWSNQCTFCWKPADMLQGLKGMKKEKEEWTGQRTRFTLTDIITVYQWHQAESPGRDQPTCHSLLCAEPQESGRTKT